MRTRLSRGLEVKYNTYRPDTGVGMWNGRASSVCVHARSVRDEQAECGARMWASPAQSDAVMAKHINNVVRYRSCIWVAVLSWSEVTARCRELVKIQRLARGPCGLEPGTSGWRSFCFLNFCCPERVKLNVCDSKRDTRGSSVTQIFHHCLRQRNRIWAPEDFFDQHFSSPWHAHMGP